jgi:hypothetical protein
MAMSFNGIENYVSFVDTGKETYRITVGALNSLSSLNLTKAYPLLNEIETSGGKWGGGDGVGGSDRALGTKIHPELVLKILQSLLSKTTDENSSEVSQQSS